ncbi:MAG: hypothetical protein QNJ15_02080 [Erythrobacter sp.]|nr:hypothetical protein [Erythrobacter sp.]
MTSPSQAARNLAFDYRAEARNQRAKAAEMAADHLYEFSRKFPGNYGQELRDILDNLDDPASAAKARDLSQRMRAAFPQMTRDAWRALGTDWDWEEMDALRMDLFRLEAHIGSLRRLANHLEAAVDLDKGYDAMMDMADYYVELGQ